jgi:putative heme-binding domain-containing protein
MNLFSCLLIALTLIITGAIPARAQSPSPAAKGRNTAEYQSYAMTHRGDATRGKALFNNEQRLACSRCHAVDGKGGKVGPDLFAVGDKFGRFELVEAVLAPSKTIAVGYSTTIVKTKAGEVFDGVIKDASAERVELMGSDGRLVRIAADDIARRKTTDQSLMPEGLYTGLTLQEFSDLVEYLASLKAPQTSAMSEHGMPDLIRETSRPVRFEPFNRTENDFEHPVWFGPLPGVADSFAVVEHESGKVWVLHHTAGAETKSVLVDTGKFQPGTRGLLSLAFHPDFASNRKYYLKKHFDEQGHFATYLFEGEAAADLVHDSGHPLRQLIKFDATTNVHYGGGLAFGPDGMLYVGMGDTGPQQDPQGHGQDTRLLLGKMLRIDVNHQDPGLPYAIPKDNPFVGRPDVRPEIWATGFRVPWRISFDSVTGELWAGDVGQDLYEEVDVVRKGKNYGWNVYEGFAPFSNRYRREGETYTPPVFAYSRKYGPSVTGGYVYRGDEKSPFYGVYVFGDYESRRVFGLTQKDGVLQKVRQLAVAPQRVVSFGRGNGGELYLVGYEGTIYAINFDGATFE